jgi:hypothetical protein
MSDAKTKGKRICGTCHKPGHNSRTCPVKKAAMANGASPSQPQISEAPISTPPTALASTANVPMEFEGAFRTIPVGDTILRVEVRETAQGLSQMTVRVEQRDRATGQDRITDLVLGHVEVAGKMYELLGWALQRHAVRAKMALNARTNGVNHKAAPAPAST